MEKRDWFGLFTSFRHTAKHDDGASLDSTPSPESLPLNPGVFVHGDDEKLDSVMEQKSWITIQPDGNQPPPRYDHAATVIGRRMVIVGGESENNRKLNDVHVLHFGKLTWSQLGTLPKENGQRLEQLPPCKGHSLISWGKTVLLVAGDMNTSSDRVTVWSFDLETERWTKVQAKGDIPAARSGQSVTRAGSILVMFGGEDMKGHKLNDLHVLDLKSLMWLPLHTLGKGPSPRAKHVAAMYDDRYLLVFGGASKSKVSNDLYALDFETMMWSRLKPGGPSPSPRKASSGVLVNDKWYICGGINRGSTVPETIMLDIPRMTWSTALTTTGNVVASNQRASLVVVQKKERTFLVAFGGCGVRPFTNEVQTLCIASGERKSPITHAKEKLEDTLAVPPSVPAVDTSTTDVLARLLDSPSREPVPGLVPLRKIHSLTRQNESEESPQAHARVKKDVQFVGLQCTEVVQAHVEEARGKPQEEVIDPPAKEESDLENQLLELSAENETEKLNDYDTDDCPADRQVILQLQEKLAIAGQRAEATERELDAVRKEKEQAENKLHDVIERQDSTEAKLGAAMRELDALKLKLEASELVQEEANSLSNIVHTENLRLERDLSFLKTVMEETQKELNSTRGVLASERSRAFQLQVELFELKQKLQQ